MLAFLLLRHSSNALSFCFSCHSRLIFTICIRIYLLIMHPCHILASHILLLIHLDFLLLRHNFKIYDMLSPHDTTINSFIFLLNKKSQNHVNGLGSGFVFFILKKIQKKKKK
jgi:hypothetical protein